MPQGVRHMVVVEQLVGHGWVTVCLVSIAIGLVTVLGHRRGDLAQVLVRNLLLGVGYLEEALPCGVHLPILQLYAKAVEAVVKRVAAGTTCEPDADAP